MKAVRLFQIAQDIPMEGLNRVKPGTSLATLPKITDGMHPKPLPRVPGLFSLEPEQLLNVLVEPISVNGRVEGYQREARPRDARGVANYLRDGGVLPVIELAIDGKGRIYCPDGFARILGAVIARLPVDVVIRRFNLQERGQLFSSQRYSRRISADVLTLADDGPFERYIQDAVAGGKDNPWAGFVSTGQKAKTRIAPFAMYQLLIRYVGNRDGTGAVRLGIEDRWNPELANELFPLVRCFGTKATNPAAFKGTSLQGIGSAAMWVFRRNEHGDPGDVARWQSHMPKFRFEDYPQLRTQKEWTAALVAHWNRGLRGRRRVKIT